MSLLELGAVAPNVVRTGGILLEVVLTDRCQRDGFSETAYGQDEQLLKG